MCKSEKTIESMAAEIRGGDYSDFGKLLQICAYIPAGFFDEARKIGYEDEDVYQEAGIAFLHALHSYDGKRGAGFRTYASVCIRNHIASLLRSGQRQKNSAMTDYVSIDDIDVVSKNEPESDWIEKEAFSEMKKRILGLLSDFEFEVLRLYLNGFSYKMIGKKLSKTEKSVSNALSRVRKKLREEILPEE